MEEVIEQVINSLDSENIKGIIRGILGEVLVDFEKVLSIIHRVVK